MTRRARRPASRRERRGIVAVLMVASLLLLNLVIVGVALSGARDHDLAVRRLDTVRAFYAAEAGANMAVRELMQGSDEDGDGATGTISDDADDGTDPAVGGSARVVVTSTGTGPIVLRSAGRATDARRSIDITLE